LGLCIPVFCCDNLRQLHVELYKKENDNEQFLSEAKKPSTKTVRKTVLSDLSRAKKLKTKFNKEERYSRVPRLSDTRYSKENGDMQAAKRD